MYRKQFYLYPSIQNHENKMKLVYDRLENRGAAYITALKYFNGK